MKSEIVVPDLADKDVQDVNTAENLVEDDLIIEQGTVRSGYNKDVFDSHHSGLNNVGLKNSANSFESSIVASSPQTPASPYAIKIQEFRSSTDTWSFSQISSPSRSLPPTSNSSLSSSISSIELIQKTKNIPEQKAEIDVKKGERPKNDEKQLEIGTELHVNDEEEEHENQVNEKEAAAPVTHELRLQSEEKKKQQKRKIEQDRKKQNLPSSEFLIVKDVKKLANKLEFNRTNFESHTRGYTITSPQVTVKMNLNDYYRARQQEQGKQQIRVQPNSTSTLHKEKEEKFVPTRLYNCEQYPNNILGNNEQPKDGQEQDQQDQKKDVEFMRNNLLANIQKLKDQSSKVKTIAGYSSQISEDSNVVTKGNQQTYTNGTSSSQVIDENVNGKKVNRKIAFEENGAEDKTQDHPIFKGAQPYNKVTSSIQNTRQIPTNTIEARQQGDTIYWPAESDSQIQKQFELIQQKQHAVIKEERKFQTQRFMYEQEIMTDKLQNYTKLMDDLVKKVQQSFQETSKQHQKTLKETTSSVSSTISNTVNKTLADIHKTSKQFYDQFEQLQAVTQKATKSMGTYTDIDKKIQRQMAENMKRAEQLSMQMQTIENKVQRHLNLVQSKLEQNRNKRLEQSIFGSSQSPSIGLKDSKIDLSRYPHLINPPDWSNDNKGDDFQKILQDEKFGEEKQFIEQMLNDGKNSEVLYKDKIKKELDDIEKTKNYILNYALDSYLAEDIDDIINVMHMKLPEIIKEKKKMIKPKRISQVTEKNITESSHSSLNVPVPKESSVAGMSFDEIRRRYPQLAQHILKFSLLSEVKLPEKDEKKDIKKVDKKDLSESLKRDKSDKEANRTIESNTSTSFDQLKEKVEKHDEQIQTSTPTTPSAKVEENSTMSPFTQLLAESAEKSEFHVGRTETSNEIPEEKLTKSQELITSQKEEVSSPQKVENSKTEISSANVFPSPTKTSPMIEQSSPPPHENIKLKREEDIKKVALQQKIDSKRVKEIKKQKRQEEIEKRLKEEQESRARQRMIELQFISDEIPATELEEGSKVIGILYANDRLPRTQQQEQPKKRVHFAENDVVALFTDTHGIIDVENSDKAMKQLADKYTEKCIRYLTQNLLSLFLHEAVSLNEQQEHISEPIKTKPMFESLKGCILSPEFVQFCIDNRISFSDTGLLSLIEECTLARISEILHSKEKEPEYPDKVHGVSEILDGISTLDDEIRTSQEELTRDMVLKLMIRDLLMQREPERKIAEPQPHVRRQQQTIIMQQAHVRRQQQTIIMQQAHEAIVETSERSTSPILVETGTGTIATSPLPSPEKIKISPRHEAHEESVSHTASVQTDPLANRPDDLISMGLPHAHFFFLSSVHHDNQESILREIRSVSATSHVPPVTSQPASQPASVVREIEIQTAKSFLEEVEIQTIATSMKRGEIGIQTKALQESTTIIQAKTPFDFKESMQQPPRLKVEEVRQQERISEPVKGKNLRTHHEEVVGPVSKHLFSYLQESEVERKLRMELMQRRPTYLYKNVGDSDDSISTLSSQETFSTVSGQDISKQEDVEWAHEILRDANSAAMFDALSSDYGAEDEEYIQSSLFTDDDDTNYSYGELIKKQKELSDSLTSSSEYDDSDLSILDHTEET